MVHHSNEDAMNKIPLKSASGLDSDEEKNGGELMQDTTAAEEARREKMRAKLLAWMKKLTIVLICFIGIALISYVIISLCFSDWPKSTPYRNSTTTATTTETAATAATFVATSTEATATAEATFEIASSTAPAPPPAPPATTTISTTTTTTTTALQQPPTTATATATTTTTIATTTTTTTESHKTLNRFTLTDEQSQEQDQDTDQPTPIGNLNLLDDGPMGAATTPAGDADTLPNVAASTSATAATPTQFADQIAIDISENFSSILGVYQKAAVSSDNLECSKIGSDILSRNGSAVDAAIAALLCNGLLTLQSMGIGGGFLMNVYSRQERHATSIDAREVAPYAAEPDIFDKSPELSIRGPLSIAVPGEVMGYHEAHTRFGQLPWADLVAPSLKLCEAGYHVSKHMARALKIVWPFIKEQEHYKIYANKETGLPHASGTVVKPPKQLCESYKLLAENGPLDMYNGTLAKLLVEDLSELGSIITGDDLQYYSADVVHSITMELGEDTLYVVPPVSSGSVVAHALSILQGYNLTSEDLASEDLRARTLHRFAEAIKFGFAHRSELGDLHFIDVRELVSKLNSPEFGAQNRAKINDSHVLEGPAAYGAQFGANGDPDGTANLVVLAPNGDAVSVTSSVNSYFGSSLIGPRTGIVLNNGMNDFAVENNFYGLPVSQANTIAPHKRPMSSQSPLLLADRAGDIRLAIGAAGGARIIPAVVEVAARVLWFGQDLKTAIDAPRVYHQLMPDVLEYEKSGFSDSLLQLLSKRGHVLKPIENDLSSVVTAIARNATAVYANADYRKRGGVAGF
ncbi:glutathione hydrolase 1 proenzyme isoform X2 [Drosophila guanche]|nr:glutathione hydrolase 1 proenzyme isoform X2 [Drosophila guanche]SPP78133.1 blast:Gamma-glutamyltranspeptidase 1 [Drosophila guanche]